MTSELASWSPSLDEQLVGYLIGQTQWHCDVALLIFIGLYRIVF